MTKVIMHGCNGKMGQTITAMCKDDPEIEIVAGIDLYDGIKNDYPVFPNISVCDVKADAVIDFSNAKAVDDLLIYCEEKQVPVVLCTTGLSEEQLAKVKQVSGHVAVLKSANMSLGINMLMELLKKAALTLAPAGFDMEIVEKHHNQKLDAPSGTALALADSMNEALNEKYAYVYDRSRERKKREKYEIGISAVRGGNIVGEHEVIFAGQDEVIEFKHTAYSKAVFGKGAVQAAKFLAGREPGLYDMQDVIRALEEQGVLKIESEQVYRNPVKQAKKSQQEIIYTEEQQHVIQGFRQDYLCGTRRTYLLQRIRERNPEDLSSAGSDRKRQDGSLYGTDRKNGGAGKTGHRSDSGDRTDISDSDAVLPLFRRQSFYHELKTVCRRTLRSDDACEEGRDRCDDRTTFCTFYSISGFGVDCY